MTETRLKPDAAERSDAHLFDEAFLRALDRLVLVSKRVRAGQLQGERRSPKRGQSVEFADYRQYAIGDDFRQIDWNVYARLERFFLKLFIEEEDLTVHLLVDSSASMDWGEPNKLDHARRLAGALGYIALAGLDRVTVSSFGAAAARFPAHRGKQAAYQMFAFLQDVQAEGGTNLAGNLRRYAQAARNPGPLLLISDLFDPGWQEGLRALLARRFDVTVLHLLAPQEVAPDLAGDLRLRDAEGGVALEVTVDTALLQRYADNLEAWQAELRHWCSARAISYVRTDTSLAPEELVQTLLRRQGVVH
ncbi:MAG: DUF58 domain-containing protein [Ardenticatenaceae bacterium]|nr:DUF58 domain-containing protein [Ardenticatenaceae bacterium]